MKYLILIVVTFFSVPVFSQDNFIGIWETGEDNTKIEICKVDGQILGRIKSSDNSKAKVGKVILKDLNKKGGKWKGRIFAAKRGEWYNVEITPDRKVLKLKISVGLLSKTLEWKRTELVSKAEEKYNVLFIAVDDLRPELNSYGADYILSPSIAATTF